MESVCGICIDGAPAMLGSNSGFQKRLRTLLLKQKEHIVLFTDMR